METLIYIFSGVATIFIGAFIIITIGVLIYSLSVLGNHLGRNIAKLTKAYKDNQ